MRGTPATEEIPRRYHHRPPQMMQQTQPLVNPQSQQKMVVPSQTAQSLIRGQQQQQQFDSSNSSSNGGGGSDDTISYFAPSAVPQRDINSGNNDNQTDGRKTTGGVGPRRQKQRQKLLRRSVPSAVFYDDGESPVRC